MNRHKIDSLINELTLDMRIARLEMLYWEDKDTNRYKAFERRHYILNELVNWLVKLLETGQKTVSWNRVVKKREEIIDKLDKSLRSFKR